MQKLTVDASTNEVAQGLFSALAGFWPEIVERADGGYQLVVALGGGDEQIIAILSALERHVTERGDGPAKIELAGRSYTLHAQPEQTHAAGAPAQESAGRDTLAVAGARERTKSRGNACR
jgi:hypothetical protein